MKDDIPPNKNSRLSQSLVDEFPATRSSRLRSREIVIGHQPSFPERIVGRYEGEELVCATDGKHILGFAEREDVVDEELDWDICDSGPLSRHLALYLVSWGV